MVPIFSIRLNKEHEDIDMTYQNPMWLNGSSFSNAFVRYFVFLLVHGGSGGRACRCNISLKSKIVSFVFKELSAFSIIHSLFCLRFLLNVRASPHLIIRALEGWDNWASHIFFRYFSICCSLLVCRSTIPLSISKKEMGIVLLAPKAILSALFWITSSLFTVIFDAIL